MRKGKLMQFASIFHLLSLGRPMIDYEGLQGLLSLLKVKHNPSKHGQIPLVGK